MASSSCTQHATCFHVKTGARHVEYGAVDTRGRLSQIRGHGMTDITNKKVQQADIAVTDVRASAKCCSFSLYDTSLHTLKSHPFVVLGIYIPTVRDFSVKSGLNTLQV